MIGAALSLGAAPSVWGQGTDAAAIPLDAEIVVMGEEHDAPDHHLNQADWIARLDPAAVVFEMLPPDLGPVAEDVGTDDMNALGEALRWDARGWPNFATYFPIFEAAEGARHFGAELDRDTLSRAVAEGAAAVFEGTATLGLATLLDPAQRETRENLQDEAHCGLLPSDLLPGMVEAQRLRDAVLAQTALDALDETGGPVAIVTGNGHARTDWGVPAMLAVARPDLDVLAIGQVSGGRGDMPFDAVVLTDPPLNRDADPCDALR